MKKIFILLSLSFPFVARSQSVGIGIATPNPSAILQLESNSKGFLLPNMATFQRLGIVAPADGLMVYDFNTKSIWMYTPSGWTEMVTEGTNLWGRNSSDIYRSVGNVGIGLSTPVNRLQVHNSLGSTNFFRITNSASSILASDGLVLGAVGSNASLMNLENGTLAIGTNNDTVVNITNAGRLGIGTTVPLARLHISDGDVIFSASVIAPNGGITTELNGAGTRMMWLPNVGAFRAGTASNNQWDWNRIGVNSFASGRANIALGESSTAMGDSCLAFGKNSFAAGERDSAMGYGSTAIGMGGYAGLFFGNYSSSKAAGTWSTAIAGGLASGNGSIAIGLLSKASSTLAFALGHYAIAEGPQSVALGNCYAKAEYSLAMGKESLTTGESSIASGVGVVAKSFSSFVTGSYNDSLATSNQTTWVPSDPLFIVGNGTGYFARKNAMVVYKNGNTDLNGKVNVNYLSDINNAQLNLIENNGAEFTHLAFFNKNGVNNLTDKWLMRAYPLGTNASRRINFYTNGGANSGDILTIFGNGNATLAGILTQLSDARLKKNIRSLQNVLPQLNAINAYHYQWLEEGRDSTWQIGVLAQEVQQVFPELVMKDDKGNLSVNYSGLIPVLLASVKEQQAQIEQLKKQNEEIIRLLKQK